MRFIEAALKRATPMLGLCLGGQLLAHTLGENVHAHPDGHAEYGYYDLTPAEQGRALFGDGLTVLQSHWHGWYGTPKGAAKLAGTALFPEQAFRYGANAYGFQFHPESSRNALSRWIARRPPARHAMKGAHAPDRQLADNLVHDVRLGRWFEAFLEDWAVHSPARREAAE
jgi:GMP synthase (glutamine-hydrolysing)